MSSRTVSRKAPPVRKVAAAQNKARRVKSAKAKTGSALDAAMAWLPFNEQQLHRIFMFAIFGAALALVWTVAVVAGVPQIATQQIANVAAQGGFVLNDVKLNGVKHLNELKVYELVLSQRHQPMPQVDVDQIRTQLMQLSWVEDARVSRQLPDTLVIDVVERKAHAVLKKADRLVLIDATGHELQVISAERAKGKLVVSGPGAGQQVVALASLLEAAPALKPQVAEAEWVGNRRWNLKFRTGQILALPEGDRLAAGALVSFARLDGVNRLLGGKALAFDMRAPDRIYFRVPEHSTDAPAAGATAAASLAVKPAETAESKSDKADTKPEADDKSDKEAAPKSASAKTAKTATAKTPSTRKPEHD
ncbi:MAG: FtsQ-type POTRA domain-containing protein [Novosphingobium sp.]